MLDIPVDQHLVVIMKISRGFTELQTSSYSKMNFGDFPTEFVYRLPQYHRKETNMMIM